jgi:transcriptional regulator GlxA family with amidase domain
MVIICSIRRLIGWKTKINPGDLLSLLRKSMHPKTKAVIKFMQANLHRKISLAELSKVVGMSSSHLGHLFKIETGLAPGQYLMRLRVRKARGLLMESTLSVKQIMFAVGFNDKSDFVRSFKKAYGLSPSDYRGKCLQPTGTRRIAGLTNK